MLLEVDTLTLFTLWLLKLSKRSPDSNGLNIFVLFAACTHLQVDEESGVVDVHSLRVIGALGSTAAAAPGSGGLSVFRPPKPAEGSAEGGSQSGAQRDALAAEVVAPVELFLAVHVADMVSQVSTAWG